MLSRFPGPITWREEDSMRSLLVAVPVALAYVAGACHQAPPPQVALQPAVDSSALRRARQDSIARAGEAAPAPPLAARPARPRRAPPPAALQRPAPPAPD